MLTGCQGNGESISEEEKTEIIHAYWETYCQRKSIPENYLDIRVYGVFGDVYVFFVDGGEKRPWKYEAETVTVANIAFHYPSTQRLVAYNDGQFYDLQSAYENDILLAKNLEALPHEFPENGFLTLSDEMKAEIAEAYADESSLLLTEEGWFTVADIGKPDAGKLQYLGTYNGYDVLFQKGQLTVVSSMTVAGYTISCNSAFSLRAYKDGNFHDLQLIYDEGKLTKEDIAAIHRMYRQYN